MLQEIQLKVELNLAKVCQGERSNYFIGKKTLKRISKVFHNQHFQRELLKLVRDTREEQLRAVEMRILLCFAQKFVSMDPNFLQFIFQYIKIQHMMCRYRNKTSKLCWHFLEWISWIDELVHRIAVEFYLQKLLAEKFVSCLARKRLLCWTFDVN